MYEIFRDIDDVKEEIIYDLQITGQAAQTWLVISLAGVFLSVWCPGFFGGICCPGVVAYILPTTLFLFSTVATTITTIKLQNY